MGTPFKRIHPFWPAAITQNGLIFTSIACFEDTYEHLETISLALVSLFALNLSWSLTMT